MWGEDEPPTTKIVGATGSAPQICNTGQWAGFFLTAFLAAVDAVGGATNAKTTTLLTYCVCAIVN
jgi:hypothetical protein